MEKAVLGAQENNIKGKNMKNSVLDDIKNYALNRLQQEYGYCGVAEGDNVAMLNSGKGSENIIINIKCENDGE